jgi:hypothetical protein
MKSQNRPRASKNRTPSASGTVEDDSGITPFGGSGERGDKLPSSLRRPNDNGPQMARGVQSPKLG